MTETQNPHEYTTCYHCAKLIYPGAQMVRTSVPNVLRGLGIDFPKVYHPKCYRKAEALAAAALRKGEPS
jgi:hypothetical protein